MLTKLRVYSKVQIICCEDRALRATLEQNVVQKRETKWQILKPKLDQEYISYEVPASGNDTCPR